MNKKLSLILIVLISFFTSNAQTFNVSGHIKDAKKQEPIIGAAVFEDNTITNGTPTDTEGYFSLDFDKTDVYIRVGYIGFVDTVLNMHLTKDTVITVFMKSNTDIEGVELDADSINWKPKEDNIAGDGKDIDAELVNKDIEIKDKDFIIPKTSYEIAKNTDLDELFIKKGSGINQTLTFIDGARLYSTKKAFIFLPLINKKSIQSIGYFYNKYPAAYGSYLSSVLDVKMKEGDEDDYKASLSASLFNASFNAEGPVIDGVSSFYVAAGISYFNNPYTNLFRKKLENKLWAKPGAFDFFAKYTHQLTENDKVYTSVYYTADKNQYNYNESFSDTMTYSFENNISNKTTNILSSLHWEHIFSPDFYSKVYFTYSRYNLNHIFEGDSIGVSNGVRSIINKHKFKFATGNDDLTFNLKFNYNVIDEHKIDFGVNVINHIFRPVNVKEFQINDFVNDLQQDTVWAEEMFNTQEYIVFAQDKFTFSEELSIEGGLHFSTYVSESATYFSIEPRIFAKYNLFDNVSVNISYSNHKQYLHTLANRQVGLTTDIFVSSNKNILPQFTHHASIGADMKLPFNIYLISNIFYNYSTNVLEYKDKYGFYNNEDVFAYTGTGIEDRIEQGKESIVGARIILKKDIEKLSIKASHFISYSQREFANLNFGKKFSYRYNTTHDFNLNLTYKISEELNAGINWMFKTGSYITPTRQSYLGYDYNLGKLLSKQIDKPSFDIDGNVINNIGDINTFKLPAYHRADLFVNYTIDNHVIGLNIYNVYNRKNADFVDFKRGSFTNSNSYQLASFTVLPFFPVLSYTYNFE